MGDGKQERQVVAVFWHCWQGEVQKMLTVRPVLTEAITDEVYRYWLEKEEEVVVKANIRLDIVTANPDTDRPTALTVKVVPDREQVKLPAEQLVLAKVVMSAGRVIVRLVRDALSPLSSAKGAVTVRVTLEGVLRAN